jgi:excisionase family DNA binding protein
MCHTLTRHTTTTHTHHQHRQTPATLGTLAAWVTGAREAHTVMPRNSDSDPAQPAGKVHTKTSAASFLAVSRATLDRFISAGELDIVRVGGQVRITQAALDDYLLRHTIRGKRTDLGHEL